MTLCDMLLATISTQHVSPVGRRPARYTSARQHQDPMMHLVVDGSDQDRIHVESRHRLGVSSSENSCSESLYRIETSIILTESGLSEVC